ncbi:MAG: hypothetical protein LBI72_09915 [Flavobacteriaceae bacterium]|jgi:hypothetical protein|nr:hypothetical protein [Flavobacteriaceae bacterium]
MKNEEYAIGISTPISPEYVLTPTVLYADELTGIYFETTDEQYGRITFFNLDAIRICRGEYLPYQDDWTEDKELCWVYEVQHSSWQVERYIYEKKHYGRAYEFGGNVNDMLTEFKHYIFSFHDQFIEVIAKGFWWEKDNKSLLNQPLQQEHPFLPLSENNATYYEAHNYKTQIRTNPLPIEQLIEQSKFCPQKLYQFALIIDQHLSIDHTVSITNTKGKIQTVLSGYFGKKEVTFEGITSLETILPYIDTYILEVVERRKAMGK